MSRKEEVKKKYNERVDSRISNYKHRLDEIDVDIEVEEKYLEVCEENEKETIETRLKRFRERKKRHQEKIDRLEKSKIE